MYDGPFSRFVADVQNMIYQQGWIGLAGQKNLFSELYHDGYQYILIPELQPGQNFEWQLGLTSITVGIGNRALMSPANQLGLIPNYSYRYGVTGFTVPYTHRLDYVFVVNDAGGSGGTYVIGIILSPLTPK